MRTFTDMLSWEAQDIFQGWNSEFIAASFALTSGKKKPLLISGRVFLCRYVSILTLVRVRTEQRGLYTALISHEDDAKEVTFDLEVQGKQAISINECQKFPSFLVQKHFYSK